MVDEGILPEFIGIVNYGIIAQIQPDEIYNLAAQSHVHVSFDVPEYSGDINARGRPGASWKQCVFWG